MSSLADSFLRDFEAEEPVTSEEEKELVENVEEEIRQERILDQTEFKKLIEDLKRYECNHEDDSSTLPLAKDVLMMQKCNEFLQQVDSEILQVFRFVRETYGRRFPELESLVPVPLDYLFVVKQLRNSLDTSSVDLNIHLSNAAVLAVSVAASVSIGQPLTEEALKEVLDAAAEVDELIEARTLILAFIERSMAFMAPNLTAIAGASLAARLVTHAGGLEALATMPAQNLLLLGGSAYARGASAVTVGNANGSLLQAAKASGRNYGVIFHADIVQQTIAPFRIRAMKLMAGKCALAVRKDVFANDGTNTIGRQLREKVLYSLKQTLAPPPARLKKPLPIPEEKPKARRGGRRKRRLREKYGMTEARKKANRLHVTIMEGQPEEYDDDGDD